MADTPQLNPLNDLNIVVGPLESVASTGVPSAITTGTVTGFLATTDDPAATAADATLSVTSMSHVGGNSDGKGGTYASGTWLFQLDAAVLTKALLETHFAAAGAAYLHVKKDNDVRCVTRLDYSLTRRTVVV